MSRAAPIFARAKINRLADSYQWPVARLRAPTHRHPVERGVKAVNLRASAKIGAARLAPTILLPRPYGLQPDFTTPPLIS